MALPTTGPLSINDIATEFGGTAPHSLSEYYAGGGLVPAGTTGTNGAVPSSGQISISQFYGTSNDYPATTLTYNGQSLDSPRVTLSGSTAFTVSVSGSTTISGARISQLHIVCWGAGGAGATWPSTAAGGFGGAGYRASWLRSSGGAVATFLNSITSISGGAGNGGTSYLSGSFPDNRQAGGAGGSSFVNINGSTLIIRSKGGNGARSIYPNNDTNFVYATVSSSVGDNGGTGAAEGGNGGNATYGGGGGASNGSTVFGTSTYGGRGGSRNNGGSPGTAPAGGGGGYDTGASGNFPKGGVGRVVIYINTSAPF